MGIIIPRIFSSGTGFFSKYYFSTTIKVPCYFEKKHPILIGLKNQSPGHILPN